MKLKFIDPSELDKNIKATIHKTGKLGFTMNAAKKFGFTKDTFCLCVGINAEDRNDKNLYGVFYTPIKSDGYKISKAGNYFYAHTKRLFDTLKVNYKNEHVVYDIQLFENGDTPIYKFNRRK